MVVVKNLKKPVVKVSVDSESEEESSSSEESVQSENDEHEDQKDEMEDDVNVANPEDDDVEDDDGEDDDVEDNDGEDADAQDDIKDSVLMANEGWADSIAKILSSNKPKNKRTLVLSRAKKHSEILKVAQEEKPAFEVIGEADLKPTIKKDDSVVSEPPAKKVKHDKPSVRVKPNILEKDREKVLSKIATKGVVQLFNAVRNQQKTLQKDMDRNDLSEGKKEKILKKFDKRAFLDTLMGQSKSVIVDEAAKVTKDEIKDEDKPKWSALRDDFMMGAKMKDWDKESIDD